MGFAATLAAPQMAHALTVEVPAITFNITVAPKAMAAIPALTSFLDSFDLTAIRNNRYFVSWANETTNCNRSVNQVFLVMNGFESAVQIGLQNDFNASTLSFQSVLDPFVATRSLGNANRAATIVPENAGFPYIAPLSAPTAASPTRTAGFCPRPQQSSAPALAPLDASRQCARAKSWGTASLLEICLPAQPRCDRTRTAEVCPWLRQAAPEPRPMDVVLRYAEETRAAKRAAADAPGALFACERRCDGSPDGPLAVGVCPRSEPMKARERATADLCEYEGRVDRTLKVGFCPRWPRRDAPGFGMLFIAARVQESASCPTVCATVAANPEIAQPGQLNDGRATMAAAGDSPAFGTQPAQDPGPQAFFNLTAGDNAWTLIDATQYRACTWIGAPRFLPWWEDEDTVQPVPEPSTMALMLIGLIGLGYARHRQTTRVGTF